MKQGHMGATALTALVVGIVAAMVPVLAILDDNFLPILSRDAFVLFLGGLLFVGIPVFVGLFVLDRIACRSASRRQRESSPWPALVLLALLCVLGAALATRDLDLLVLFARRYLPVAVVLGGIVAWRRSRGSKNPAGLLGWAAVAIVLSVGLATLAGGARIADRSGAPNGIAPGSGMCNGRIVVIGVDGLCWETLQRWGPDSSEDFEWLRKRSSIGPLETLVPTESPRIWTSIATGVPPRDHGVIAFTSCDLVGVRRPLVRTPRLVGAFYWLNASRRLGWAHVRPVGDRDVRRPPFWEIVGDAGCPSAVAGWWATWPARPMNGVLVSDKFYFWRQKVQYGFVAESGLTHPPEIEADLTPLRMPPAAMTAEEIRSFIDIPEGLARVLSERTYVHHDILSELPIAYTMDETYFAVAERLIADSPPRALCAFYLRGVDIMSHSAMHFSELYPETPVTSEERSSYGEALSRYYAYAFSRLRALIELVGEDSIILIVSDHGFERVGPKQYNHYHAPPGVIIAVGGGAARAQADVPPSVYDVAPTVLWLAGYPVAEDMPGRPLMELFPELDGDATSVAGPASYGQRSTRLAAPVAKSDQADEEMFELLRTLGYINEGT